MLLNFNDSKVYAFECNNDCLIECNKNSSTLDENIKQRLFLINKAVSIINGEVIFYPFDLNKYNNMGAKIDFSTRNLDDPLPNPQTEIIVNGIRLDTFIDENKRFIMYWFTRLWIKV